MTNLTSLSQRLEQAEGADRELDALIYAQAVAGEMIDAEGCLWARVRPRTATMVMVKGQPKTVPSYVPAYTASIDAAMSLVPREAFWRVGHDGEGPDPSLFRADVLHTNPAKPMPEARGHFCATAATPALALASAAIRALAAQEQEHG